MGRYKVFVIDTFTPGPDMALRITLIGLALGAVYLVLSLLGVFNARLSVELNVPEGVDGETYSIHAISTKSNPIYKVRSKKLDENGNGKLRLDDGENYIYIEYDGISRELDSVIDDDFEVFSYDGLNYEMVQNALFRAVIIDLKSVTGEELNDLSLSVYDSSGSETQCLAAGDGRYVLILDEDSVGSELKLCAEGYESLMMKVESSERLSSAVLTLMPAGKELSNDE